MAEFKLGRLRFVWKGTWTTGTSYVKDDIVKYGGTAYVCVAGHIANANFNVDSVASRWQLMAGGQSWVSNPWGTSTTYKLNDLVKYGGNVYICTVNHTSSATANSGFYTDETAGKWDLLVPGNDWKGNWAPSTYYKENDLVKYNGRTYICLTPHPSVVGSYLGESLSGVSIVNPGTGYTDGYALTISAPTLPGGVQATGTINVGGASDSITSINITENGSGYTTIPTITVVGDGSNAILVGVISNSFVNGLETDQEKWQVFSEGFQWRGEWNGSATPGSRVSTSYALNDIVKFGASLYLCITAHTSNASAFQEANWTTFTKGFEFENDWGAITEYQQGDVVSYGGYVYVATARNTSQIPPTSAGFWALLTTGFNNRDRYISSQSYKVGDLIQYGGNTFVANSEITSNESPYSASAKWSKLIDGFRWLADWSDTPTEPTYKIGDVVKYRASTFLCINEHVPSEENSTVTATATNSSGNVINVGDSSQLNPLQAITFTGTGFGNLTNGVTYYVKAVLENGTDITISQTPGGTTKVLTTASGSMTGTFTSQPNLDDGTFWDSFVEGDANNVLIRRGDIVTRNAIQNVRLPKGVAGTFLKAGPSDLLWGKVGQITRIFYVSTDGIDAADRGRTLDEPWRTVKYACNYVRTVIVPTIDTPAVINVKTGVYTEEFPISIPKYSSLVGDELRMSIIEPTPATSGSDKFYMRDSTTMRNFTVRGATGANLPNGTTDTLTPPNQYGTQRPTGGAWVSLDPGTGPNDESVWVGQRSPYIQNVTLFGDYCVGQKIDGALHNGGNKSITSNDFTTILSNGVGAWCTNQGRGELVSVFAYYSYMGYLCENGGVIRATNGNNSYGTYGSVSEGVDPTEISRTATVDNRRLNALVDRVQTDGANQIVYLEYLNAGETYTTATYGFEGSGTTGTITASPVIRNGGVTEVRILSDGENYTSVTNNAQAGTYYGIRLSASDIQLSNGYNGQRIFIVDGSGAGQYAYITSFDGGSKEALLGVDSFTPITVTNTTASTNRVTVASTATLSVDMPFSISGTGFGGIVQGTQYFVKELIAGGTQFTVYTNPDTKTVTTLSTASGTCLLHKAAWDVVVSNIAETISAVTKANPAEITTSVAHAYYDGMQVTISGVVGMTQLNGNTYYITKTASDKFTLYSDKVRETSVDSTGYTTYISGGAITGQQTVLDFLNTTSRYVIEPRIVASTGTGASATAVSTPGINTITVSGSGTQGGGGFTIPPEVIISGDGTATGGTGATATATILGSLDDVIIQERGSGYQSTPTLTFVGGGLPNGSANHATASATITSTIKEVEVVTGGSGFTTPPSVIVSGTGGSGAIIAAQISNVVGSVALSGGTNSGGSGYTSAPTVEFVGGEPLDFAEGTAVLSGSVTGITMQEGGSGYDPSTTTVTLIGGQVGAGVIATANVIIDNGSFVLGVTPGIITSIVMDVNGTLYSQPPAVVISSPTGVDASATANISGSVASVTLTNPGRGYQTTPSITFSGGGGTGAQGTVSLTGSVISLTVVDGGRGWTGATPTLAFSGGGGIGADADVITMDSVVDQITITSPGTGYTSNPAISVTGGNSTRRALLRSRIDGQIQAVTITDPGGSFLTTPLITFANGNNFKSPVAGLRYYANPSARIAIGLSQQTQTLAGIERLRLVARAVINNQAPAAVYQSAISRTAGSAGPAGIQSAVDVWTRSVYYTIENGETYTNAKSLMLANREFIRAEAMAFWAANYPGVADADWSNYVGLTVDAVGEDLGFRGVTYSTLAGIKQVFLGTARTTDLATAVAGIEFVRDLVLDIVQNDIVTAPLTGLTATATAGGTNYITVSSNTTLVAGDTIIFIGTGFGNIATGTVYYISERVNSTTITISATRGGAVLTLFSSSGTLTVSKQFINDTLTLETGATTAVTNLFNYVSNVVSATVANSSTYVAASSLLLANKQYIKAEVIGFINAVYPDFDYNQSLCARDVGFIVDAMVYDLVNAVDNNPTVTSATTGVVSSITVDAGGLGYSSGVSIAITGGGTPSTTATAVPVLDSLTGAITSFTMTNKGRGYTLTPSVVITPDNGSGALLRARVVGGNVNQITVIRPGSNYDAGPHLTLVDPNNTSDATFLVRVANGVLDQPRFTSRGIGFTSADALVDGDGYADIAQVGQFVYVDNLTNIPTPGANIQFEGSENFFKLVTVRDIQGPTGIIGARNILLENKLFVQYEIISYLNNFSYNSVKCSRDTGFIIDAVADDFTYGGNTRLLAIINQYQRGTYASFDQQRSQTASAIEYLQTLLFDLLNETTSSLDSLALTLDFFIEWLRDSEFYSTLPAISMPSAGYDVQDSQGKVVILANESFIVAQTLAWMNNNTKLTGRDNTIFGREIRQAVRSVAYDLNYTGNSQTVEFASSYYVDSALLIPGALSSGTTAKSELTDTFTYLKTLLSDVAVNNNVTPESGNTLVQLFPTPTGDTGTQGRINTLMTAVNSIITSGFAGSGVSLVASDFSSFTTTKRTAVLAEKTTLLSDVITWIDDTFVNFTYDQDVCFRDTGLIVQAFADDIFGDVAKSVEAGQRYYAATATLVLSDQRPQTAAAIHQINYIIQALIRNETYTRTQTDAFQVRFPSITNGDEAGEHLEELSRIVRRILTKGNSINDVKQTLLDNKTFIQSEVVAFVTASYENLDYDVDLCYRDVGLMIDALAYDIYGGLSRAREAGLRYYQSASALRAITGEQLAPTLAAIDYLEEIVQAILNNSTPAIAFQEAVARTPNSSIVYPVDNLFIDDKATTFFNTVVGVINNGPNSLPPGRYSARLQVSPQVSIATAPAHDTPVVLRSRYSQVRLTGHDFLNIGTGSKNDTNYPGIPLNAPNQNNEIVEQGGGRCFYTSTDQDGNFRVGELFKVEQSTGIATLNADAFNLSGLNELSLGGVSLGGSGATINEFSTDGTFFANSDNIVPTQKAIKTYIQSALGSGGGNIAVNAVTAGDVFITAKEIDTIGGLPLNLISQDGVIISSTEGSTDTATGSLIVGGGVGVAENLNAGGNASINGTLTVGSTSHVKIATGDTLQRPGTPAQGMMRFNTSTLQYEGYNGTQWSSVGGGNPWVAKTSAYTAVASDRLLVNTASAPVTISLPASPALGDTIKIIDATGTFDLNPLTINRSGQPIMGDAENMTVDNRNAALTLIYYNATYGWRLGE